MDQLMQDKSFPPVNEHLLNPKIIQTPITPISPVLTDFSSPKSSFQRQRRSRLGCLSCKKLKIKCNEVKPSCEYCTHRGKICQYPEAKPRLEKKRTRKPVDKQQAVKKHNCSSTTPILACSNVSLKAEVLMDPKSHITNSNFHNSNLLQLNSMTSQMKITPFELRLLKVFLQFGPSFFTFNVDLKAKKFWTDEIPKLCVSSPLIQKAIYSVSSVRLLGMYSKELSKNSKIGQSISLYQKSLEFQKQTSDALELIFKESDELKGLQADLAGQVLVAKMIIVGCKGIFPHSINPNSTVKNSLLVQLTNFMRSTNSFLGIHSSKVMKSKYSDIISTDETLILTTRSLAEFPFITHLRSYILENHDVFDSASFTYNDTISMFELCANRAVILGYPVPFFRSLVKISRNDELWALLNNEDHTAMKLIYYLSALCSALAFGLIPGLGVWDEFIQIYKNHCFKEFGGFESEFDQNVYDFVMGRQRSEISYSIDILKIIGLPVEREFDARFL